MPYSSFYPILQHLDFHVGGDANMGSKKAHAYGRTGMLRGTFKHARPNVFTALQLML
jgi:hypothetical protein